MSSRHGWAGHPGRAGATRGRGRPAGVLEARPDRAPGAAGDPPPHLVHADFLGLTAGRLARLPVLVSTKHGFNPFRDGRAFAAADRAVSGLADVHIAISAGLARYLAESEGSTRRASRSSTTGSIRA